MLILSVASIPIFVGIKMALTAKSKKRKILGIALAALGAFIGLIRYQSTAYCLRIMLNRDCQTFEILNGDTLQAGWMCNNEIFEPSKVISSDFDLCLEYATDKLFFSKWK